MCFSSFKSTRGSWFLNRLLEVKHWQTTLWAQELWLTAFCSHLLSHLNFTWRAHLRSLCEAARKCQRTQNIVPENIKESSQYNHGALKYSKLLKPGAITIHWGDCLHCEGVRFFNPIIFVPSPKTWSKIISLEGQILSLAMGFSWWWNSKNFCG